MEGAAAVTNLAGGGRQRELIADATAAACAAARDPRLRAVILTGSLARDEGTFMERGGRKLLLGDAEFLVVFDERASLPGVAQLDGLRRLVEDEVARRGLTCLVQVNAVRPDYLRRLPPSIFAYELRACGQVVWGDARVLGLIPAFAASRIPLDDAWRLLCNRMVEYLEIRDGVAGPSPDAGYSAVKLVLDTATSLLVFAGAYAPTYRARAERVARLAAETAVAGRWPFALPDFAGLVVDCTRWKVSSPEGTPPTRVDLGDEAVRYARQSWRWELERLTDLGPETADRQLWMRWMRRQPVAQRLRGWLQVAREQGWHRGWRDRWRWLRFAWRASPRYWVYAAAVALCGPPSPKEGSGDALWESHRRRLPVLRPPGSEQDGSARRRLVRDIAWNYHRFLVQTRS